MVVRQVPKEGWCAVCDSQLAEVEISHEGSHGEICLLEKFVCAVTALMI